MTFKTFNYLQAGSPQLSGKAGANLGVLDYCLADGGSSISVSGIVVSSLVATVTTATPHGFQVGDIVLIAGAQTGTIPAPDADLNGDRVVGLVTNETTFAFTTVADDDAVTGTLTVKRSPLGFAKAYTGSNLRAYRAASGERDCIRVDDTGAANSLVRGYDAMSGISTGTGPYPTTQVSANGYIWKKSAVASSDISVSGIVVAGTTATVTCATAHGLNTRDTTTIAGATPSGLNGIKSITLISPTKFSFVTSAAAGAATGTITSTKVSQTKWYLFGDAKRFYYFVERANDVFDIYAFGESVATGDTITNLLVGLNSSGGSVIAGNPALTSPVAQTYLSSSHGSSLWSSVNDDSVILSSTTSRTLDSNRGKLSEVFIRDNGITKGIILNLFAPLFASSPSAANGVLTTVRTESSPTQAAIGFKVILGSLNYVGNVFVGLDTVTAIPPPV
jgi:hypothetical protein